MKEVELKELFASPQKFLNEEVVIRGWVRTNRDSNRLGFIELNDGTTFKSVQIVYEKGIVENFEEISKVPIAAALKAKGTLIMTPESKQAFEINAREINVEAGADSDYPLQKKRHSMEFLREIAHLRPRSNTFSAVFRVRSILSFAIHKYFQENGFVYVHTPIITGNDCEGAGEMFRITTLDPLSPPLTQGGAVDYSEDFFGKETSLTVSGQLEGEAFALAFRKIYTFGPTFRAENSNTARHASEFWMVEPEIAFADLQANMNMGESLIKYIIQYVLDNAPDEMDFFNSFVDKGLKDRLKSIVEAEFGKITYTEAVKILMESGKDFQFPVEWGIDLQTEHERYLTEEVFKKPLFVTDYPKDIKAFYMRMNDDGKTVAACDLLVPGVGEIIGGSQREERYDVLLDRMNEMGINPEDYKWYLDIRKYGGVEHSGFGLGFERILMYITGISNIRDVLPFPRTPKSAEF
jgi:asparaginyl-tRNA synthetase